MRVFMPDIQAFAPNVWIVDGPRVRDMGVMFTTRMTIVQLSDGSLWVDSPVPVPFETLKGIMPHTVHVEEGTPAFQRHTRGHAESWLGR